MYEGHSTLADRFFTKTRKALTGCIEWTARKVDGYGRISIGSRKDGNRTNIGAHRVAYELFVGPIPDGLFVLHRCDNRACVNPTHLFLGTNNDNMADMISKGRQRHPGQPGELHGQAKLTIKKVLEIRRRCSSGESYPNVAKFFGVSVSQIHRIARRLRWTHLP